MATLPETQTLALDLEQGWLTVWFNQPERRNPLTDEAVEDLAAVIDTIKDQRDIRGMTIRGKGGFFCAGGDLKGFNAMASGATEESMRMSRRIGHVLAELNALPQVTVAMIEGAAMAGGLGVACCCDVTIGMSDAKFGFSETRIGITPAQIARYVLQKCGYSTGRRLMVTAARFTGDEAGRLGVLDFVAEDADALADLETRVKRDVLECAPGAVAACKALIIGMPSTPDSEKVEFAAMNFSGCLRGEEGKEGVASFVEKRKPNWHTEI
jgi:isohexenylglutaconyl-CoA hydratase